MVIGQFWVLFVLYWTIKDIDLMLTLFQTTALTDGLNEVGTAHHVGVLMTTGLERSGAL